jgi:penicillin G amidase
MRRVGRLIMALIRLVVVLLILAIVGLIAMGAVLTQRGWAQTTGTITAAGLHHPVSVLRDAYGIIQISADDSHDLFLAQGYVHAQERMWQMEMSRRIGAGRLSELFGPDEVATDTYIRTLGWRQAAQRDLNAMSPDSIDILQAYSDGVNDWIKEHDGRLSTPFVVTGIKSGIGGIGGFTLEKWTPLDTATWQKVQAWSLGGNVDSEIFRMLADQRLGSPAKTDELFPPYDPTAPVITPSGLAGSGGAGAPKGAASAPVAAAPADPAVAAAGAQLTAANAAALTDIARLQASVAALAGLDRGAGIVGDHGVGSNNWVVAGSRTASGKPILANDPHLGFSEPSVWIMNGLHCTTVSDGCPWDVIGVTFPGAPGVVLGHNEHIAWGATNVGPDTEDLFLETPDPVDPAARYLYQGQAVPYDIRHETIKVAGAADVVIDVKSTRHGVVLSDVDPRLKDGPILALRWTTTAEADLALESFFKIDRASNFDQFKAAFAGYGSPSQNFIYADTDGHIGYVLPGLIPIRADGCPAEAPSAGVCKPTVGADRVRDGESGRYDWIGYVPRDQLPWQLDPAGGQIVSANNEAVDGKYPFWLGDEWDPGYRAARISTLLGQASAKLTADDMRAIETDTYVGRADTIVPELQSLALQPSTADGRVLWGRIVDWDRHCDVASVGCAAYITTETALQRAIFDDELGPIARDYVGTTMAWQALIEVLRTPKSSWWTNTANSSASADPAKVAAAAIDATAAQLRAAYGDPANWTWGKIHTVQFKEGTLGTSPIFAWYFNSAPTAVAGADGAIDNTYYQISQAYPDPHDASFVPAGITDLYDVTNGPSYRFTIDMSDLDGARIVITTGQSGNPFDTHYGDLISTWIAGGTVPLPFSQGNVQASAITTLTLSP